MNDGVDAQYICLQNPRIRRIWQWLMPYIGAGDNSLGRNSMFRFASRQKLLVGILVASSLGVGYALGAQPRMDAALALLTNARAELEAAVPNKGGHRERAIELVDRAIVQVREGIAFAATH
jgi:hypothetical protein